MALLKEKFFESLSSVLPITAIVLLLCITIAPVSTGVFVLFLLGAFMLIFGMSLFTGPRTKFTFTGYCDQNFKHFSYDDLEEVLKKKVYYWEVGLGVKIYNVFFDFVYDLGLTGASRYINAPKVNKQFKAARKDNILSFSVGVIF